MYLLPYCIAWHQSEVRGRIMKQLRVDSQTMPAACQQNIPCLLLIVSQTTDKPFCLHNYILGTSVYRNTIVALNI